MCTDYKWSSKKRVLTAVNLKEPDRVPVYITVTPQVAAKLSEYLGIEDYTHPDSPLSENRISYTELLTHLGNDIVGIGAQAPESNPTVETGNGIYTDEWKIKYRRSGYYTEMIEHPLSKAESVSEINDFEFPDPKAPGRFDSAEKMVKKYGKNYAVCGDVETTIFEASWYLVGMEKFFIDFAMKKPYIFALLDHIMQYSIGVAKELIRLGADIIWLGDDFGSQKGMIISPKLWREVFKERMKYIIDELKGEKPGIKIAYHSCGSYFPIMRDLIDVGVDILNALQPNAKDMDIKKIKDTFGSMACLFGGIDIQRIVPFGSLKDLENEVKRVINNAAEGGGYILAGAHNLQPDTSVEKVIKLFEFAREYGKYPLRSIV